MKKNLRMRIDLRKRKQTPRIVIISVGIGLLLFVFLFSTIVEKNDIRSVSEATKERQVLGKSEALLEKKSNHYQASNINNNFVSNPNHITKIR